MLSDFVVLCYLLLNSYFYSENYVILFVFYLSVGLLAELHRKLQLDLA